MTKKFQIADWTVDPQQCLLIKTAANNRLEPKAMALLVVLAEANGELVSRQKIFETVWPNQHVSDYALNTLIANLRKSLGSQSDSAPLIETRPKLGYRLSQQVVWLDTSSINKRNTTPTKIENSTEKEATKSPSLAKKLTLAKKLAFVFLAILLLVLSLNYFLPESPQSQENNNQITSNGSPNSNVNNVRKNKVIKYTVKVALSYSFVEKDKNGNPYCNDFSFEMLSKAIYNKKRWKLVGNTVTFEFDHRGEYLADISETHTVEYINFVGKRERDQTTMTLDAIGGLSGSSLMEVFDENDKLICKGKSLFIGTVI